MAVIEELRGYSWKEVAKHNTSKSAYIVVRNKVCRSLSLATTRVTHMRQTNRCTMLPSG